jgi:hypothetical protein
MMGKRALRTVVGLLCVGIFLLAGELGKAHADQPKGWGGGGDGYELSRNEAEKHAGEDSTDWTSPPEWKTMARHH